METFKEFIYKIKWHVRGYFKSRRAKKLHSDPFYDRFHVTVDNQYDPRRDPMGNIIDK